jgi:hypothetical protein
MSKKKVKDPIVEEAVEFLRSRSRGGIKKYGTTLQDNNKDDFLLHLQEELGDALNYIVKLKSIKKEKDTELVERFMTKPTYFKCKCGHKQKL